ncbi:hypothetical protein [Streptomyces albus]|uniref:hypothetical protein n=1 Tax=Streptomyces albus TaxID=1888 RepID=UPI001F46812D|nr:hypothetical protein [Streptomyces albus]GHJ18873.1 hypothetical protein TPA0909_04870 [Streptomyces albus]
MKGWAGETPETPEQFLAELERRAEADKARKVSSETPSGQPAHVSGWPEGVIARYLTVGGAKVDVTDTDEHPEAVCGGCPQTFTRNSRYISGSLDTVHRWAQEHAEKCRALPRPEAGGR